MVISRDESPQMKRFFLILLLLIYSYAGFGQESKGIFALAKIEDGDTVFIMSLPTVFIYANHKFGRKHDKLVRNVRKVYPYAHMAGEKLNEYSVILAGVTDEKEVKRLMDQAEDELKAQYREDLEHLTISQGKILLKLVDRETGHCTYNLLQDLRGRFSAFFWQTFARIFGYNLKTKYDPYGEDADIEEIVLLIEKGLL